MVGGVRYVRPERHAHGMTSGVRLAYLAAALVGVLLGRRRPPGSGRRLRRALSARASLGRVPGSGATPQGRGRARIQMAATQSQETVEGRCGSQRSFRSLVAAQTNPRMMPWSVPVARSRWAPEKLWLGGCPTARQKDGSPIANPYSPFAGTSPRCAEAYQGSRMPQVRRPRGDHQGGVRSCPIRTISVVACSSPTAAFIERQGASGPLPA